MPATIRPLLAAAVLTAALTACNDPYGPEAQLPVVDATFFVYGINDVPVAAPSAIFLYGVSTGRPDVPATTALAFDLAVDVTAEGSVRLITPRALISIVPDPMTPPHAVGMQLLPDAYESVTMAPNSGYKFDSLLTVTPGQTIAVQSANPAVCPQFVGTFIYAKLVVDSVRTNPARVYFRATVDPNCDFRSLVLGVPED